MPSRVATTNVLLKIRSDYLEIALGFHEWSTRDGDEVQTLVIVC